MKSLWLNVTPLLICLFLASGCSAPLRLNNVLITIVDYSPTTAGDKVRLKLHFSNENIFAIAIAGITGKLYLEDNYVGKFELTEAVGIPQLGTLTREAELLIEKPEIIQKLHASSATSIAYKLDCNLHMEISEDRTNSHTYSRGLISTVSLLAKPAK